MKVKDIMTGEPVTIDMAEPVSAAARLLRQRNIGALPVCDGSGKLRGIVTDRDIVLRCVAAGGEPANLTVAAIMTRGPVTVSPEDTAAAAAVTMAGAQVRRLPVCDEGRLVGMVSLADLARCGECEMEAASALAEISNNFHKLE